MEADTRVWTEIDPSAIQSNAQFARRHTGRDLIAVVKADAYGHGVACAVQALRDEAQLFAVANVGEAAEVRQLAPQTPVLLLSPCLPAERGEALALGCIATVTSAAETAAFGSGARVSLKVDTGMGRIGVWHEEAIREVERIAALPGVELHSIATHLPVADEDEEFSRTQLSCFAALAEKARGAVPGVKFHALNSAGLCAFPEYAFDFVRVGLLLYGSASIAAFQPELRPALAWKARITLLRDVPAGRTVSYGRTFATTAPTRIATLAVGYADGYPRQASGHGAQVLVGGRRCAILGRVTMDQILVDVTAVAGAAIGDEAVLIGSQGAETIFAGELAEWGGTIAWDIFTGIGGRTKRVVPTSASAGCG
jgi:alanine racemase